MPVFWLKNQMARQLTNEPTLPRNAEFRLEGRMENSYRINLHLGQIYDFIAKKQNYFGFFLVITINFVFLQKDFSTKTVNIK